MFKHEVSLDYKVWYSIITKEKAEIELMAKRWKKVRRNGSMNIVMKYVSELQEYDNNPRNNDDAVKAVAK